MTDPPARSTGRYALRHVDGAGTIHLWTCAPTSAHWVGRWHARDSGRATEVLRDDGEGWRVVTTWTPDGDIDLTGSACDNEVHGYEGGWYEQPDDEDDEAWGTDCVDPLHRDCDCYDPPNEPDDEEGETSWRCRPIIDYAVL